MFSNYLLIAIRQLRKNKVTGVINLVGFTLAIFLTLVVVLFVQYHDSFDRQFSAGNNIYRLIYQSSNDGQSYIGSLTKFPMGPTIERNYPEVIASTRIQVFDANVVSDYTKTVVSHMARADSSFFKLFDFKILDGERNQLLSKPNCIVLTKSLSDELFPSIDPIGKSVRTGSGEFTVTGLIEDLPDNSHFHFQAIRSFSTAWAESNVNNWGPSMVNTYLLLNESAYAQQLEIKLPALLETYLPEEAKHASLSLQPLNEIHLQSGYLTNDNNNWKTFNKDYLGYLIALTLLILLIVGFNYVNISTASAIDRAKEIGLRKSVGASKYQIASQFVVESVLFCLLSMMISVGMFYYSSPFVNQYFHLNLSMNWSWDFLVLLVLFSITVGCIAGLLPSISASLLNPVLVLKGAISNTGKSGARNILVMAQFTFTLVIILCALHVSKQLDYTRKKDLGFSKDQVIGIQFPNSNEAYTSLKNKFSSIAGIVDVTAAGHGLGKPLNGWTLKTRGDQHKVGASVLTVDRNYIDFFEMPLMEGRNFEHISSDQSDSYIINEALMNQFEWKSGINQSLGFAEIPDDSLGRTIGVVRDFHFESLHSEITPLALHIPGNDLLTDDFSELYVKIDPQTDVGALLKNIEGAWNELVPDQPFDYYFIDETFAGFYENDKLLGQLADSVAVMSCLLAFMGLFGISYLSIKTQIKGVVVRKIVGASNQNIIRLLITPLSRLILTSSIISAPVAYFLINYWLESFAYRISIDGTLFLYALLIMLFISIAAIAYQIGKALRVNPVNVLRNQ